jgi:hypothetical protein
VIYLTGVTSDRDEPALVAAGIGLMVQPGNSYHLRVDRYPHFGADNGCFGGKWDEDTHLAWLDRLPRDRCLFAVAPDVYPDAAATLERSAGYFDLIRGMGFPVALVAQDGAEHLELPWADFDCLFVGGKQTPNPKDEWKLSAAAADLCRRARAHGKWVHMGRVNGGPSDWRTAVGSRMERARAMGCHSADGTYVKYRRRVRAGEPEGARDSRGACEIAGWLSWLDANQPLNLSPFEGPSLPVHRSALS